MKLHRVPVVIIMLILTGCTTLADVRDAKGQGEGETATYAAGFEEVWDAVVEYIEGAELDLITAHQGTGIILAERGVNFANYGDNLAVFVDAMTETTTAVAAVHKKVMQTNIFGAMWAKRVIEYLDERFTRE